MQISGKQFLSLLSSVFRKTQQRRRFNDEIGEGPNEDIKYRRVDQIAAVWETLNGKEVNSVSSCTKQFP